jgi:hypothetical protein
MLLLALFFSFYQGEAAIHSIENISRRRSASSSRGDRLLSLFV